MKIILSLIAFLALPIFADINDMSPNLPIVIEQPVLAGDCVGDDISVVEENGQFYIAAFFTNMDAVAEDQVVDKKRCSMKYNVHLDPNFRFDVFQFSVDGVYQLSEHGSGRLTVSHRVVDNASARTTKFYSASQGDAAAGDIEDFTGAVTAAQLPASYSNCGASIPLTTTIYVEAVKPDSDRSGFTRVSLNEGLSSDYVKLSTIEIDSCQRP